LCWLSFCHWTTEADGSTGTYAEVVRSWTLLIAALTVVIGVGMAAEAGASTKLHYGAMVLLVQ
jgi:hypothetical protein